MTQNRRGRPRHPDVLTPAEWRVLDALREGATNAEIAARLGISRDTVKYHVSNMLAKLGLDDRRALAEWRPDPGRGRMRGVLTVPVAVEALGRSVVTVGVGVAAVAGAGVAVVAAVAVVGVVLVAGGGNGEFAAVRPLATATPPPPSPTPIAPSPTVTPTPTPPATPTPAPIPSPSAGGPAVTASPVPGRCTTPNDPTCVVAVYLGSPTDYAQVADIPADKLLTRDDGRYYVERGEQYTVVTAAQLPSTGGWTRFYLGIGPGPTPEMPSPVSASQLIPHVGTTYTFTVTDDERGASLIEFDLTAAKPRPGRPNHKPQLGDVVVTTEFLVPTLRYNLLDTSGAATAPGSYAFLTTAGDAATAIDNFGRSAARAAELRIHPTAAAGVSRAAFYDAIQEGGVFDYRTDGVDCAIRFRVTRIPPASASPRSFGIEFVYAYGGRCGDAIDDPESPKDVEFVWFLPPGLPNEEGGVRAFMPGEPTGKGTYRLSTSSPYVVDIPAGIVVVASSPYSTQVLSPTSYTGINVTLTELETHARLHIDPSSGTVIERDSNSVLDAIESSIRTLTAD